MAEEKKVVIEGLNGNRLADRIKKIENGFNKHINSSFSENNFIYYILLLLLAVQYLGICYFNLFQADKHLGFDASSNMLNAVMMWEQKKLLPDNFAYQTALFLGPKNILAALVYGLVKDISLSFGIVNIVITACLMALVMNIFKALDMKKSYGVLFLNIMLTPYVSPFYNIANPLGYFPSMFFTASFTSISILQYLMVFRIFISFVKGEKNRSNTALMIISIVCALLSGFSLGYSMLVFLILPMLIYVFARIIAFSDIKYLFDKTSLFTIVMLVSVFAGKIMNSLTVGYESKEASMALVMLQDFWKNFGNIFLGFAGLLSAGNTVNKIQALSFDGIISLAYFAVVIIFFLGVLYGVTVYFKNDARKKPELLFVVSFCFVNFFMYSVIDSAYGGGIFEERYLIPFFIFGIFLVAYAAENLSLNVMRNFVLLGTAALLSVGTVSSFAFLNNGKATFLREIKQKLSKYDSAVVYCYSTEGSDMHVYARDMRVIDTSKVYKLVSAGGVYHWGDYTYYDDVGDYPGDVLIMLPQGQFEYLPEYLQKNMEYFDSCWNFELYHSKRNLFDYETGLSEDGYSADIPCSDGVILQNCFINDDGGYQTDGTPGCSLFGPYRQALPGRYRFTLHYNFLEDPNDEQAVFDVSVNGGNNILGGQPVDPDSNTASVEVEFDGDEVFEYRLWVNEGEEIEIEYIEMEKIA